MGLTEEQKEMVKKFVGDNISSNKKIDDHLEKMYRKKEKSMLYFFCTMPSLQKKGVMNL